MDIIKFKNMTLKEIYDYIDKLELSHIRFSEIYNKELNQYLNVIKIDYKILVFKTYTKVSDENFEFIIEHVINPLPRLILKYISGCDVYEFLDFNWNDYFINNTGIQYNLLFHVGDMNNVQPMDISCCRNYCGLGLYFYRSEYSDLIPIGESIQNNYRKLKIDLLGYIKDCEQDEDYATGHDHLVEDINSFYCITNDICIPYVEFFRHEDFNSNYCLINNIVLEDIEIVVDNERKLLSVIPNETILTYTKYIKECEAILLEYTSNPITQTYLRQIYNYIIASKYFDRIVDEDIEKYSKQYLNEIEGGLTIIQDFISKVERVISNNSSEFKSVEW